MALKNVHKNTLTITRVFDAPRDQVWKAWTVPAELTRWWGPKGFTSPVANMDVRVGGRYLYCMRSPDGKEYWSTGVYREIVPMERIVCADSFSDEQGNIVTASEYGLTGNWPLVLKVTVSLTGTGGRTTMVLQHEGIPEGPMLDNAREGWNESFDKLAESLGSAGTSITAEPGRQEIVLTRILDAAPQEVFRAYSDPGLIPQWWGPRRFATIVDAMEVKPGGIWRFINRDASGNEYAFHGVYHEVRSPVRIVSTFEFEGTPGSVSLETLALEELNNGTKLTARSVFQTIENRDLMLRSGMEDGARETMDRLAELLGRLKNAKRAA